MERDASWLVHRVMVHLLFAAQLLASTPQPAYASPALRDLVERAAEQNRASPPSLEAYRAQVESEIAVLTRRADGEEVGVSLEQAQNDVYWQRSGEYAQHVTGYRARLAGPSISALAVLRKAWTIPVLYGNRLSLFFGRDSSTGAMREASGDEVVPAPTRGRAPLAVHPLAPARDRVYTFSGGDTIAVIQTGTRAISVVRVQVEPRAEQVEWPVVVFRGEINLDADRGEIVRMRGQFLTLGRRGPQQRRLLVLPVSVMAYVDLECVEVNGRYWLPRHQRIETHVNLGGLAEGRSVFRIVSRFRDHRVTQGSAGEVSLTDDAVDPGVEDSPAGEAPAALWAHRLTLASRDSLTRPRDWILPLGEATASLRGDDFADVGALPSSPSGSPTIAWQAQRLADVVHFNRVEGWNTGAAVEVVPGAAAPGLTLRANAGWAWTEQAVRGRIEAMRASAGGTWTAGARVGRTLDITNDFTAPHDSGGSLLAALVGIDGYDYVDRKAATLWVGANLIPRVATVRLEAGWAVDSGAPARLTRGLVSGDTPFGPNRGVDDGRYARAALVAEWNPGVNGSTLASGLGAQLRHETGAGQLDWHRTTLRVTARDETRAFGWAMRVDGGLLASRRAPPQQLFELGGSPVFPGFDYKEFAGDRALATHARAMYRLPVLRSPVRILGCTCFTAPAPALAVTLHAARLSAGSAATMASVARLGSMEDRIGEPPAAPGEGTPVSRPTDGWRSSVEVGLRFFGGAATLGVVRVTQPGAPWRTTFALGQAW